VVNLHPWGEKSDKKRPNRQCVIPVGEGIDHVLVRRLHADAGTDATGYDMGGSSQNVTWAGEQWSWKIDQGRGHFIDGNLNEEKVDDKDGKAYVDVPSSGAVIVSLDGF
jgi:hypothetical protein